ncbi:MAG: hypothetical protein KBC26_02175 [Candidatus Pacebacteria bacterium]|nr:hypothetical protein [Candidatus Paceibacterota bacterium]
MNKKTLLATGITVLILGVSLVTAFAQPSGPINIPGVGVQNANLTSVGGWVGVLITVIRWLYHILFVVAVLMIIWAAFLFVTSKGDPKKTDVAKNMIKYAIIGMIVALLSYVIVQFIQNAVTNTLTS